MVLILDEVKLNKIRFCDVDLLNEEIVGSLSKEIREVNQIRLGVYQVRYANKKYLFKFSRTIRTPERHISFIRRKVYMKNFNVEKEFNLYLRSNDINTFNYPILIGNYPNLLVFEYVENISKYKHSEVKRVAEIISIINSFSEVAHKYSSSSKVKRKSTFLITFSRDFFYLCKEYSYKYIYYYFKYILELLKIRRNKYAIVHNDFAENILITNDKIYLSDFESISKSYFELEDAVSLAVDLNNLHVNNDFFTKYISTNKHLVERTQQEIRKEIQLILIASSIRGLRSRTRSQEQKSMLKSSLDNIFLKESNYVSWYSQNFTNKI